MDFFLYQVLEKFGFNEEAVNCIKTLYKSPTTKIRINSSLTRSITLEWPTRQGCCLSPTSFTIFIEPLAHAVRQNENLRGIKVGGEEHAIGLFADDVIQDPDTSIPILINQLETFRFCSGYKLNLTKTQVLIFNYSPSKNIQLKYNLNWRATKMKYLGVTLTQRTDEIYEANYIKMDKEIETMYHSFFPFTIDNQKMEKVTDHYFLFLFF